MSIAELTDLTIETDEPAIPTGKTIFLLEQDDVLRAFAARMLKENGHQVLDTQHSEVAYRTIARNVGYIDLLILPAALPDRNGVQFIQELRKVDPDMSVILTYYTSQTAERYRGLTDLNFLHKPFSTEQLMAMVDAVKAPISPGSTVSYR